MVGSSAVSRDIYQQTFYPKIDRVSLIGFSRRITLILASVALAIAVMVATLAPGRTVFWYVIFGWSGIAATFCPVMILSLFWRRYNAKGALATMLAGVIAVPVFKFLVPLLPRFGPLLARAEELAPSFLVALVCGIVTTWMTNDQEPDHVSVASSHQSLSVKSQTYSNTK